MPTYEYLCKNCGHKFEVFQGMFDEPIQSCPKCQGETRRLISGGNGFILKEGVPTLRDRTGSCRFEETGLTCCGAKSPCEDAHCHGA